MWHSQWWIGQLSLQNSNLLQTKTFYISFTLNVRIISRRARYCGQFCYNRGNIWDPHFQHTSYDTCTSAYPYICAVKYTVSTRRFQHTHRKGGSLKSVHPSVKTLIFLPYNTLHFQHTPMIIQVTLTYFCCEVHRIYPSFSAQHCEGVPWKEYTLSIHWPQGSTRSFSAHPEISTHKHTHTWNSVYPYFPCSLHDTLPVESQIICFRNFL